MAARWLIALAGSLALASVAPAAPAEEALPRTPDAFMQVFKAWAARHGVRSGTVSVAFRDRLVLSEGVGGWDPARRSLIASLSKAVTALCTATLVRQGRLGLDTRAGQVLDRFFQRFGEPQDGRIRDVTIGQLLSHRAGFARGGAGGNDSTTGSAFGPFLRSHAPGEAHNAELLALALRAPLESPPGHRYAYSNTAYLMLGVAIETVTGRAYDDYCGEAVLKRSGVRAPGLDEQWRVLSSFGGWSLNGPEYLTFLRLFDPENDAVLDAAARRWMLSDEGKWAGADKSVFYSLGIFVRKLEGGRYNTWHSGSWRYRGTTVAGRVETSLGTYAVRLAGGVSWFAAYTPRPADDAAVAELDRDMGRAARSVREWPTVDLFPRFGLR